MPTRSTSTSRTSCSPAACSGRGPLAELALARNRWFTPHTWTNGLGLLANLHVAAGVGGGPVHRVPLRPARLDPGAPRRVPRRADPARCGRRPAGAVATRAWAPCSTRPRSRGTRHDPPRHGRRPPDRRRLARPGRRGHAAQRGVHRRPVRRRPRRAATFDDIAGRDGRVITDVAEGDVGGRRPRGRARRARAFDDRRWADQSPANRKRVLLKLADLIRANRDELALLESLDVGKPIRDTLAVDVPSAAKTIQWYAETIDKVYGEVGPTGPGALSLVTREPIGVVAAIVPWNYPLIITAWKLGAALATGNTRRPQAGVAVAADAPCAWRSWPPRPVCRTACSTS